MSITVQELKLYGSQIMPDDGTVLGIGGAIDLTKKMDFSDVSGNFQLVSSTGGDVTQVVTVHWRDSGGAIQQAAAQLQGLTVVPMGGTGSNRLEKSLKNASTVGRVAVESTTAIRTGTAQAGAAGTITLDAGASAVDGFYNGNVIRLTGGSGNAQIAEIVQYIGATKVATVNETAWPLESPNSSTTFRIAAGFFFDKAPAEIITVRRPFYNAAANAPGGGAINYFDKGFYKNTDPTLSLLSAQVQLLVNTPGNKVSFGLPATQNDNGTNGAGNSRNVAPGGITFATTPVNVPQTSGNLIAGSSIGVWFQLSLLDGDTAQNTSFTPALTGSTI